NRGSSTSVVVYLCPRQKQCGGPALAAVTRRDKVVGGTYRSEEGAMADNLEFKARCPHCHSPNVRPSRYRGSERLLALMWQRPYRGRWCLARFYRSWFWTGSPFGRPRPTLTVDHLLRTPFPE